LIVFISIPWFLPAYKAGGPIQSISNLIENYNDNIEYRIFCSNIDLDNIPLNNIETNKWVNYNKNTKVFYALSHNTTKSLSVEIKKIAPSVLFVIGLFSWKFNIYPLLFCRASRKILSTRGMLHSGALSQKKFKKRIFLYFLKCVGVTKSIIFHATNEEEATYVKKQFGNNSTIIIANNFPKKITASNNVFKEDTILKLITIALISPMKNYLLVLKALQSCKAFIEYNIYGPIKDLTYWNECVEEIKKMPSNITVNYNGEIIPSKVQECLNANHVFIMPSKSENFAHSIAEALIAGKPVITSKNTPWNNLQENNAGINVNADEISISNAITFFSKMNNEQYQIFSNASQEYIKRTLNIDNIKNQYQQLFFSN
jgi:glycosyltransferase involved in cell wall biosynthesis